MADVDHVGFRAMGTDVSVLGPRSNALEEAGRTARLVFDTFENKFSRFRDDSELAYVNANAGRRTVVSEEFATVLALSLSAAEETGGLFDPTILNALLDAGYDRDFGLASEFRAVEPDRPKARWSDVELTDSAVIMPPHIGLDFGGIAKGWTVDRVVEMIDIEWVVVAAGGDVRVAGDPEDLVPIAIENPLDPADEIARLHVGGGAVATSSIAKRSWGSGLHHLIDPRTSRPASTGVVQATAWAPDCATAEVRSKQVLLGGARELQHVPGLIIDADGDVVSSLIRREEAA